MSAHLVQRNPPLDERRVTPLMSAHLNTTSAPGRAGQSERPVDACARRPDVVARTKPAKLSTGAVVNVPLFVKEGEWVKVDTRTGEYLERVNR